VLGGGRDEDLLRLGIGISPELPHILHGSDVVFLTGEIQHPAVLEFFDRGDHVHILFREAQARFMVVRPQASPDEPRQVHEPPTDGAAGGVRLDVEQGTVGDDHGFRHLHPGPEGRHGAQREAEEDQGRLELARPLEVRDGGVEVLGFRDAPGQGRLIALAVPPGVEHQHLVPRLVEELGPRQHLTAVLVDAVGQQHRALDGALLHLGFRRGDPPRPQDQAVRGLEPHVLERQP